MRPYLNIQIDGAAYGERAALFPRPWEMVSGLPGTPSSESDADERRDRLTRSARDDYQSAVFALLVQISHRKSGQALIAEIRRLGRPVKIVPAFARAGDDTWTSSIAQIPDDVAGATRKHRLGRDNYGEPYAARTRGTGEGSDASIRFTTPGLAARFASQPGIATPNEKPNPLTEPDEILVHELVHALRDMAGLSVRRKVPGQRDYHNMEEFFAIVIANVYRSECNRPGLRNDNHGAFETMYVDGKNFLKLHFNRVHLQRFCRQHRAFAEDLGKVSTHFNPFEHLRT